MPLRRLAQYRDSCTQRRTRARIRRVWAHAAALCALFVQLPRARADFPIASHRYLADPGSLVSNGRVYLYSSNDDDNPVEGGYQMKSIVCVSSSDLQNWTDHGEVLRVPRDAGWANDSWAPAAVERNGRVYLYFGNNATGIGVASSADPKGPFLDARGSALVNSSTPGASGTDSWLFDPSVFIDDDGQAYLTFGGNGDANARIIALNSDMVSVAGPAIALTVPNYFEASWLFKKDGLYYFTYSTTPGTGQRIDYLTSSSPTSGFSYRGVVADQPPSNNNNNHHAMFEFGGNWYHAYHNRIVSTQAGIPTTYRRNLGLERLTYNPDGTIQQVTYTTDGVPQLASLNPYVRVEAETTNAQSGIETEPCSAGGMDVTELQAGDWIKLRGVDFGSAGAQGFVASVASATGGGSIELHLDSPSGTLIGTCAVPATGGAQAWATASCGVTGATGVHDLYLVVSADASAPFNIDYWQFTAAGAEGQPAGSGGAPAGASSAGSSGVYGVAGFGDAVGGGATPVGSGGAGTGAPGSGGNSLERESTPPAAAPSGARERAACSTVLNGGASPRVPAALLLTVLMALRSRRATRRA